MDQGHSMTSRGHAGMALCSGSVVGGSSKRSPKRSPAEGVDISRVGERGERGEGFPGSSFTGVRVRACVSVEKRSPRSPRSPEPLFSVV